MDKRSEYRSVKFETVAQRAEENGPVKLVLRGYPILFNTETRIYDWWYGEIREIILPTALDEVRLDDVYLLVGHNPDNILGRVKVNMRAEVDETGLFIECELPNTQFARDTYNLVESGILDGMSFGFTCSDQVNEATLTRTITRIDELFEVTITPFPAYKEASIVAKRTRDAAEEKRRAEAEAEAQRRVEEEKRQAEKRAAWDDFIKQMEAW